ncbi:MAG TPA: glycoside hydrolase family 3 N-terminal domain-containing protein [Flavitalea sp.]|nr:glycoside hydrolase family 3 N-terminal domain-containing protein [Flavitalea sp.]
MRKAHLLILTLLPFLAQTSVFAQKLPLYKDSTQPVDIRVKDLLARMTPEEKFWQLFMIPGELQPGKEDLYKHGIFGFQVSAASSDGGASQQMLKYNVNDNALMLAKKINSIQHYFVEKTRLGIPMIAFDEALHGLVRDGATAFPQAIALAATFDTAMMGRVATAIAIETKARGIRDILTPVVNIASDVRWGRTEETYGEDPFLSSEMGVAFVKAFEQRNIITTPKHFIANVGDGGRDSYPIHFNDRLMQEIYLVPFKACFERGGSRSVMTAYNSVDGSPATASNWLLNKTLKKDMNFKGFVISDASAVGGANVLHFTASDYADAGRKSITNGLDVIFQTAWEHHKLFLSPFLDGTISAERIDDAVSRVLRAKFELGLFEHPYVDEKTLDSAVLALHRQLARQAAVQSFVLLKNSKKVLPLTQQSGSIALIGSDAKEARLGGYSGPGIRPFSILEGIRERAGKSLTVNYAVGAARIPKQWHAIPESVLSTIIENKGTSGLKGEYYSNLQFNGKPAVVRNDKQVQFNWTLFPPDTALTTDNYSVRWTGTLTAPSSGEFNIGIEGNDGYRLYVDEKLLVDRWNKISYTSTLVPVKFVRGKRYALRIEFYESQGNAHCHLVWNEGINSKEEANIEAAVALAKKSSVAIVVAGIEEGEFRDRAMISLPGRQEELIQRVAATGTPTIVLLVGGSAITMSRWINKVDGILNIWYPGEDGGHAVADVLFGDASPAGRLPITYPLDEAQLPLVYNHKPTGRGDDYNNLSGQPLFPFGFGLSYTNFEYSEIQLEKMSIKAGDSVYVSCKIQNTGSREGEEVAQLYIRDLLSSVARPVLELKGFQRVKLKPKETTIIRFMVSPAMLEMLNEDMEKVIEPGDFRIMIGSSSRELEVKVDLKVE